MADNLHSALDRGIQVAYDFCCTVGHNGAHCSQNGNVHGFKSATPASWQQTCPHARKGLWAFPLGKRPRS